MNNDMRGLVEALQAQTTALNRLTEALCPMLVQIGKVQATIDPTFFDGMAKLALRASDDTPFHPIPGPSEPELVELGKPEPPKSRKGILTVAQRGIVARRLEQRVPIATIAREMCVTSSAIYYHKNRLEKAGLLEKAHAIQADDRAGDLRKTIEIEGPPLQIRNKEPLDIEDVRHPTGKPAWRLCLKCKKKFGSSGSGERVCGPCKNSPAWKSGSVVADYSAKTSSSPQGAE
jgi:hypothetical protein